MMTGDDRTGDPAASPAGPAEASLAESLAYYDKQARRTRIWYQSFKVLVISCGAAIPVLTTVSAPVAITAVVGAMVAALEGVQQLFGFHERYVGYRSAWNLLDRQRRLYASTAGDYANVTDPQKLLAEKVDEILQAETTTWAKDTTRSAAGVANAT